MKKIFKITILLLIFTLEILIFNSNFVNAVTNMEGIEITKAPTKTKYKEGEKIDLSGMEVKAIYADGTTEMITDFKLSGGTEAEYGDNTITIHHTEGDRELEATQEIIVERKDSKANSPTSSKIPNTGLNIPIITVIAVCVSIIFIIIFIIIKAKKIYKEI